MRTAFRNQTPRTSISNYYFDTVKPQSLNSQQLAHSNQTQTHLHKYWKQNKIKSSSTNTTDTETSESSTNTEQNTTIGDTINDKQDNTFRILFNNVNGLQLDDAGGKFQVLTATAEDLKVDFVGIAETNIDNTKLSVRRIIHNTTKKFHQQYKLTMSGTSFSYKTYYKPGGVMSFK